MPENNEPTKTEIDDYRWAMETVDAVHGWSCLGTPCPHCVAGKP